MSDYDKLLNGQVKRFFNDFSTNMQAKYALFWPYFMLFSLGYARNHANLSTMFENAGSPSP